MHWTHADYRRAVRSALKQPLPLEMLRATLEHLHGPSSPVGYDNMAVPYAVDCMVRDGHLLRVARRNSPAVYVTLGAGA